MSEQGTFGPERGQENQQEQILTNIVFEAREKPGNKKEFRSSDPSRKIIILSESSIEPEEGQVYQVKIIEDTNPSDITKGKYIAEIVLSPEQKEQKMIEAAKLAVDYFDNNDFDSTISIMANMRDITEGLVDNFSPVTPKKDAKITEDDLGKVDWIKKLLSEIRTNENFPNEALVVLRELDHKFDDKKEEIRLIIETRNKDKESVAVYEDRGIVRIGHQETPIFEKDDEELKWQLGSKQFRENGETMVEINFQRNDDLEVTPGGAPVGGKTRFEEKNRFLTIEQFRELKKLASEYSKAQRELSEGGDEAKTQAEEYLEKLREENPEIEWILRALHHLNSSVVTEHQELEELDPNFEFTPHVVEVMEKVTRLINQQLARKRGLLVLEGDAGTGKNKIIDHFAALTKRKLFRFTCSAGKDEQDLKYLLEYDSEKGTYRIKSTVIEALETPGSILEFDEINTMRPEVAKILNSLFDDDRTLYLGEDETKIEAAEGVVLVGLQNPQHYSGVKPLPETIKSRARVMEVPYPPFQDQEGKFRPDEALILRRFVPELEGIDKDDFARLWNYVINRKQDRQAVDLNSPEIEKRIKQIKEIIAIANKIREAYTAYREGKADEPITFIFSLRETIEIALELPDTELSQEDKERGISEVKKAIKEVILPKIPLGEERTYLESLINEL